MLKGHLGYLVHSLPPGPYHKCHAWEKPGFLFWGFFLILGFELRLYTLSHSTSSFL
jgi:hypothetical protein